MLCIVLTGTLPHMLEAVVTKVGGKYPVHSVVIYNTCFVLRLGADPWWDLLWELP